MFRFAPIPTDKKGPDLEGRRVECQREFILPSSPMSEHLGQLYLRRSAKQ